MPDVLVLLGRQPHRLPKQSQWNSISQAAIGEGSHFLGERWGFILEILEDDGPEYGLEGGGVGGWYLVELIT